jgi:hypothetical protein
MHRAGDKITGFRRRVAAPYGDAIYDWPYSQLRVIRKRCPEFRRDW